MSPAASNTTKEGDAVKELQKQSSSACKADAGPKNSTLTPTWLWESNSRSKTNGGVLTQDGLSQIAIHKYKGGAYTFLDNFFNPYWTRLTEFVPLYIAPNTLTTMGLAHCLFAYFVTWYYVPNMDQYCPSWVIVLNALCLTIYYTLDCMDGKQARRTNSSSPLGQLFDHGIDCLCLMQHISSSQAIFITGGTHVFFAAQSILHFSFFCAQWEEYYTGVLPHATGAYFGVTEVNYGLALVSLINGLFVDRVSVYTKDVAFYANAVVWPTVMVAMIILCIARVCKKLPTAKDGLVAVSKLFSPFLLAVCPFVLSADVIQAETRFVHLAVGLAMTLITIKVIVLSMAKQAFATVQFDALPCVLASLWIRYDKRLTSAGVHLVWQVLTLLYLYRLHSWTATAIHQICTKLGIRLFKIEYPPPPTKKQD